MDDKSHEIYEWIKDNINDGKQIILEKLLSGGGLTCIYAYFIHKENLESSLHKQYNNCDLVKMIKNADEKILKINPSITKLGVAGTDKACRATID